MYWVYELMGNRERKQKMVENKKKIMEKQESEFPALLFVGIVSVCGPTSCEFAIVDRHTPFRDLMYML